MALTSIEDELRRLIADRVRAVAEHDSRTLVDAHHPEVVSYPVLPPAETHGTEAVADGLRTWLASYTVGPEYEVHRLHVGGADDIGYCAFRYHVSGRLHDGGEVDMWVRSTLVCRRVDGAWRVVHQHESVPFDPATGAALVSEAPDD